MVMGDALAIQKPQTAMIDEAGFAFTWPGQELRLGKEIELNDNRLKVNAICDVDPTFFTFPIMYVSYNTAIEITPPMRNKMPFVLVKARPGIDLQELKDRISATTGLSPVNVSNVVLPT
jgi:putative ABC transport system permease protein